VSASIQGTSTLSCQAVSTPLSNSDDNSSSNSVQRRRCRVRHVDIHDASDDDHLDDSSMCVCACEGMCVCVSVCLSVCRTVACDS